MLASFCVFPSSPADHASLRPIRVSSRVGRSGAEAVARDQTTHDSEGRNDELPCYAVRLFTSACCPMPNSACVAQ